jgi:hypothetical protein
MPDARPPYRYPFRMSMEEREELEKQLQVLLDQGLVVPSNSPPYGAPVLFAKKKDGSLRLCIDYRALNKVTVRDRYPLPHIGTLLDRLTGATIFSKMDCRAGYHQVRVKEEDTHKTTFVTHKGAYEWKVMPMGLTNAPATFQRLMNDVLRPFDSFCAVYLDDIIVFSKSEEEHAEHVDKVLEALEKHSLRLHPEKCCFGATEIGFLGYVIAPGIIKMEPDKVSAVANWQVPRTKTQLMSFLGFTNFYSNHIKDYARITAPLTDLLRDAPPHTTLPNPLPEEAIRAFEELKEAMCKRPVLRMVDERRPFVVCTDASDRAVASVLLQRFDDGEHPVAYKSRKLTDTEGRYSARDLELLGVMYALAEWRHYLAGKHFVLRTDHESLQYLDSMSIAGGSRSKRLVAWETDLAEFQFTVEYVKGKDNVADALSRNELVVTAAEAVTTVTPNTIEGTDEEALRKDVYFGPVMQAVKPIEGGKPLTAADAFRAKLFRWKEQALQDSR